MSRSLFRRTRPLAVAGTVLAAGLALASCSGSASDDTSTGANGEELEKLTVSLGWIMNTEWAGFWIADAEGYYAEEGIDVEWIGGGPNAPSTMQTVAAGEAQIGVEPSMQQWLGSFENGNDWTAVGALFQDSPGALVSLAEDPVTSAEDLVGETVLGQEGTQINYDAMFAIEGLEPDYEFIPVGFDIAPLVDGQGKAYTAYSTNQPIMLEEQYGMSSDDYVVTMYSELGMPLYGNIIYGDDAWVSENTELLERFFRASIKGWQENGDDFEKGASLAVNEFGADLGLDLTQQIRENELQQPLVEGDSGVPLFSMDLEYMNGEMYDGLAVAGFDDIPAPEEYVDTTALDAAHESMGE